ncbi:hypothetical protein [Anaerovibrio slackiae]|uniref:hypothetical protein n=1 Tax=Anaerovibrio slackiae TaxID=2652309 RepID=UPI00386D34D1
MADNTEYQATIYDDVWRTLVHDFPMFLVAFINELFSENYSDNVRIEFLQDIHQQNQPDGGIEKRITDTYFRIVDEDGNVKKYHVECQSTADNSMLVRIFEYGAQIALDDAVKEGNRIVLEFPHAAVLFLRSTGNTPDEMEIVIKTPGGSVEYKIPVAKMQSYTIDMMFKKKLLILLPFYLFVVEKSLKDYEENSGKRQELMDSLRMIVAGLDNLLLLGDIDALARKSLVELSAKVNHHLARNYAKVQKEAKNIMGGKVLDYEAKTIYMNGKNDGIALGMAQGVAQGMAQGVAQGRASLVLDMIKDGLEIGTIARIARMSVEQVTEIGRKAALE